MLGRVIGLSSQDVGPCQLDIVEEYTCRNFLSAGIKVESNHRRNLDEEALMHWGKKRLVPTFRECHPGKKSVPDLASTPYHGAAEYCDALSRLPRTICWMHVLHGRLLLYR